MSWLRFLAAVVVLAASVQGLKPSYGGPYKGPPVVPVILPGGFIADTREVATAKEYHMNALAKQAQAVRGVAQSPRIYDKPLWSPDPAQVRAYTQPSYQRSQGHPAPVYEESAPSYDDDYLDFSPTTRRPDPMVTPRILDNGFLAETPEVDAAKAEHFAAVAKAQELVAQAQARAAQEKAAGLTSGDHTGYSGGSGDRYPSRGAPNHPSSDGTGYSSRDRGYSGAPRDGYAKFNLEYRSNPGYSRSDYSPSHYNNREAAPVYPSRDYDTGRYSSPSSQALSESYDY